MQLIRKNDFSLILSFALGLSVFVACKKEESRQYSYWVVNNDSFSTNEVNVTIGKAIALLTSNDKNNRFTISFDISMGESLPSTGQFPIRRGILQHPDSAVVNFYYKSNFYVARKQNASRLVASLPNGKVRYELTPDWFYNYYNLDDSIWIKGIFNEP